MLNLLTAGFLARRLWRPSLYLAEASVARFRPGAGRRRERAAGLKRRSGPRPSAR